MSEASARTWPLMAGLQLGFRQGLVGQRRIERIELMEISMAADRGAWTVISSLLTIAKSGHGAFRHAFPARIPARPCVSGGML